MERRCYKMPFPTRAAARQFARNDHGRGTPCKGKQRPYECPHCGQWHLTSASKKRQKAIRRYRKGKG